MSRGLDTRLSKLEAKRDMADDDLSPAYGRGIGRAHCRVAHFSLRRNEPGSSAETRARLEADPATAPVLAAMDRRRASATVCKQYAGMTEAQLDERIAQLTASLEAP